MVMFFYLTFHILIPFTLAVKMNVVEAYLNSVFLANTHFVEPIILSTTSCCCAWETVILFNFIIKHSHLASGQHGANPLLRSFVPGRSFSLVVTVRITLHIVNCWSCVISHLNICCPSPKEITSVFL